MIMSLDEMAWPCLIGALDKKTDEKQHVAVPGFSPPRLAVCPSIKKFRRKATRRGAGFPGLVAATSACFGA
jgi:hypothetical protein